MSKTFFLTIAILCAVAIFPHKTFAAPPDDNTLNKYGNYFTVFDGVGSGVSPAQAGSLIQDNSNKSVVGLKVDISLGFLTSNKDEIEKKWAHVQDTTGFWENIYDPESFVIRVCDKNSAGQCWLNTVPYLVEGSGKFTDNQGALYQKSKGGTGEYKNPTTLANFSILDKSTRSGAKYTFIRNITGTKNEGTVSHIDTVTFSKPSTVEITMWYCGNKTDDAAEGNGSALYQGDGMGDTIGTFGTLCKGGTYFKIGQSSTISIPADDAAVQAQTNNQTATAGGREVADNLPRCSIDPVSKGTINGCMAQIAYGLYWLVATVAGLFGKLFDFFLGYSLSDQSYRYAFAITGWKLVRDIANVFFIIIMVFTGFSAVFDPSKSGVMKKVIPNLIVNALLINFSLFATHVIIDISNITARMFYSQMIVCDTVNIVDGKCDAAHAKQGTGGYWPLSEKIVSAFNPQQLFQASVLQSTSDSSSEGNALKVDATKTGAVASNSERDQANYFGIICIVAALIMAGVTVMFFKVTFLFVGRVVGLYICMIFSPFAFLSRDIPLLGGIARLRWSDWLKEVTSYAMMAPVFIFFLYIIFTFLSSDFAKQIGYEDPSGNFFALALGVIIPMVIIFFLIGAAQKAAESFAGEIGKSVQSLATSGIGLAAGLATGGAALLGGRVVGGLAKRTDESRVGIGIRNMAAKSGLAGFTGRTLQRGLNAGRNGSYDVRQTGVGKQFFSRLGINADQKPLNALAGIGLGLGTDQRKGGIEADIKRRQASQEEKNTLLEEKMSDDQIKAYNERKSADRKRTVDRIVDKEIAKTNNLSMKDVKDWKKNNPTAYETEKTRVAATAPVVTAIAAIPPAPEPLKKASEITSARREDFAKNLQKGGYVTQGLAALASTGEGGAQIADLLGATVGALMGSEVRAAGDAKAAKKIKEKSKITADLEKIENTLTKGFQDMIGLEMYQTSPSFKTQLTLAEQQDIIRDGSIQSGTKKGKTMYDILDAAEKTSVDAHRTKLNTPLTDKDAEADRKEDLRQYQELVKVREQSKYNIKDINNDLNAAKRAWVNAPDDVNVKQAFLDKLKEKEKAETHLKTWQNINKHMEDQRNKLKDESK